MKRKRHTPEQIVRKLREGDRMLNEGTELTEVLRHLEVSESSWARWRAQDGGMKADRSAASYALRPEDDRALRRVAYVVTADHDAGLFHAGLGPFRDHFEWPGGRKWKYPLLEAESTATAVEATRDNYRFGGDPVVVLGNIERGKR